MDGPRSCVVGGQRQAVSRLEYVVRLLRLVVALVIVGGGALAVLYIFLERLNENPRKTVVESEPTPVVEDTVERWTYADLPERWPETPDPKMVAEGEELFRTRGCRVCHTIGEGDLVGPDLKEVPGKRDYRWALLMLLRPDSMQKDDPLARKLLKRYGVQMPDQRLTLHEAEAILHYVLHKSTEGK